MRARVPAVQPKGVRVRTLVIIGAGFSGTACACQLLARSGDHAGNDWQIHLINASGPIARGLAYGTRSPLHLLNVPAGRLGMDPAQEGDFVRYLEDNGHRYRASAFVPRMLYGEYLESRLRSAAAGHTNRLRIVTARVDAIDRRPEGGFALTLADGSTLQADAVILAMGHLSPVAPLTALEGMAPAYINDPWSPGALERIDGDERVLILGSGLTMLDVVVDLKRRGHRGPITALSRRGLLPRSHRAQDAPPATIPLDREALLAARSARRLLRQLRAAVAQAEKACIDWRDVIGSLRAITPALWQSLDDTEKRRFMRHLRPHWEVLRHRTAPEPFNAMNAMLEDGRLTVRAGRLRAVSAGDAGLTARWEDARRGPQALEVDRIVNCTGPGHRIDAQRAPLLHRLITGGLLTQDALKLGLMVDPHCRALDAGGQPVEGLYYVGPLLRAQFWEATAIPELRRHAATAVHHLLAGTD